ncbi:MAG: NAD(P)/FAD-dependent oxidoreductase, partial [Bacteroidota bacterium]
QVNNVLKRMPDGIYQDFLHTVEKTPSWGIRFFSPGQDPLELPFILVRTESQEPPGYICPRITFDDFLFQRLKRYPNIVIYEGEIVNALKRSDNGIELVTEHRTIRTKVVAGADGLNSVVRQTLSERQLDKSYYCTAIRAYFEGVTGFHPENFIELIFLKELLPAYFWIFPEVNGRANVGLGLPYKDVIDKRISLKLVFAEMIRTHPLIEPRFRNATMVTKPRARGLALNRNLKNLSGDRYLLLGDAALLVDPFTGEGIGLAMASAESAATVIRASFATGDFSAAALKAYDRRIERRMGMEHSTSAALQRFAHHPKLFDRVVRRANKNQAFKELLASAFNNDNIRKKLANPLFYARLLI